MIKFAIKTKEFESGTSWRLSINHLNIPAYFGTEEAAEKWKETLQNYINELLNRPIDMVLFCPKCKEKHIDKPEPDICSSCGCGQYIHKDNDCMNCRNCTSLKIWENPPHRKHLCHNCQYLWTPANINTNGVDILPND